MEKPTKINLGSNNIRYRGYANVDIRQTDGVDIVDDVTKLTTIDDNSIEDIVAYNIFEHVSPDRADRVLDTWVSKLKVGGTIAIGVPDDELVMERYKNGNYSWDNVIHDIFGNMELLRQWHGDDAEKYGHHTLYCRKYLVAMMERHGLGKIIDLPPNHGAGFTVKGEKL